MSDTIPIPHGMPYPDEGMITGMAIKRMKIILEVLIAMIYTNNGLKGEAVMAKDKKVERMVAFLKDAQDALKQFTKECDVTNANVQAFVNIALDAVKCAKAELK